MAQDLFGRDAGNVDVKSMFQSLNSKVSQILETRDTNAETAMAKVVDAVNQVAAKIDATAQKAATDAATFANAVIRCHQDVFKRSGKEGEKKYKGESVESKLTRKAVQQIVKMGASPNTFWVGVGHFNQKAMNQFKKVLVDCGVCGSGDRIVNAVNQASKKNNTKKTIREVIDAGDQTPQIGGGAPMGGGPGGGGGGFHSVLGGLRNAGLILSGMLAKMGDMFETKLTDSFKGVLIHSNKLRENLRTVIFQTQGYSETNRAMEKDFMDLRQATISSGVAAAKYDEQWIKNLKLGFGYMSKAEKGDKSREQILQRQIRTHKSVQTAALNTAATLGMSVDGTNDMFMSWHMQLGMSANQLANMGRSMKQISLSTGVTGENLERAMKSADSIMKTMRNTGSLTDTAAANVIQMTAMGQKLGIEDVINPLLKATSGGNNMFEADIKTKNLLKAMMFGGGAERSKGLYRSIQNGSFMNDKRKVAQAQENMSIRARDLMKTAGIQNADSIDLSNLTQAMKSMGETERGIIQQIFQNNLGVLPGEFERVIQTFEEAQKTDSQKIEDMTNKIKEATARGAGSTDTTKALIRQKNELETGNIQQMFGKISDEMKQGRTMEEAQKLVFNDIKGNFGEDYAQKLIGDMGSSATKLMSTLQERAKSSGKNLNDVLTAKGMSESEVLAALKSGTKDQRITATEVLDNAMQEIGQAESANRDPITKINENVKLINNNLQRLVDTALFGSDTLVQILFWTTKLAGLAGLALGLLQYLPMLGSGGLGRLIGGARGFGTRAMAAGRTAATTVATAGRTAITNAATAGRTALASAPAAITNTAAAGRTALASAGPMIGNAMSRALGPLILALGAVKGVMEAETASRTKLEGGILGALTGGAGTGSFMSSTLGLEKGGAADKTLGVAGGAAWGAAAGAAIGVWFGGVGAGPGALIGAAVGAVAEMIKIVTEGTTILADIFSPIQELINGIWKAIKGIGGLLWSIVTLDFGGMFQGLYDIVDGLIGGIIRIVYSLIAKTIPGLIKLIFVSLKAVFIDFPMWLAGITMSALKSVFIDFPLWAGGMILSGLKSVFVDFPMWLGGMILEGLKSVFITFPSWLGSQIAGAFNWVSNLGTWVKDGLASLATNEWVGPIFGVLGFLLKVVGGVVKAIATFVTGIMNVIKGLLTFNGEAIMEGLYEAFIGAPKVIYDMFMAGINGIGESLKRLPMWLLNLLGSALLDFPMWLGGKMVDGLKAVFVDFPVWLFNEITSGLLGFGEWIYENTIAKILDLIPDWIKSPLGAVGDAASTVGGAIMDPIGTAKTLGGKALDAGAAVLDYLNPFSYFAEGTKSVEQPGLAVLHQGEMVVPKDQVKAITAVGNGPFGSASSLNAGAFEGGQGTEAIGAAWQQKSAEMMMSMFDAVTHPFQTVDRMISGATNMIVDPVGTAEKLFGAFATKPTRTVDEASGGIGLGLFDPTNIGSAFDDGVGAMTSEMSYDSAEGEYSELVAAADRLIDALYSTSETGSASGGIGLGLFDPTNIVNAMQDGVGMSMFDAVTHPFQTVDRMISGATNMIVDPVGTAEKLFGAFATKPTRTVDEASGGIGLGLFDPTNIGSAFDDGVGAMTSEMSYDSAEGEYSELVAAADRLIDALYSTSETGSASGGIGLGLFDPTNIVNAMQDGVGMLVSGVSNTFTDPVGTMKSVADGLAEFSKAPGEMIVNRLTNAFTEKSRLDKSDSRIADAGKGMYYSDTTENMTQGVVGNIVDSLMNTPVGKTIVEAFGLKAAQASTNLMDYSDDTKGQTSTNLLDYSDTTKGTVSAAMLGMTDPESRVSQEKYGSMPEGSIAGMSGIEDYLAQEQNLMKVMIEYLAKIETNTSPTKTIGKSVIGSDTKGLPQPEGLKMRRIAQEQGSGEWDLTFGDYSPSATTMSR